MRAIIFDMDGVIIDSEPFYLQVDNRILMEMEIELDNKQRASLIGVNNKRFWDFIFDTFDCWEYSKEKQAKLQEKEYYEVLKQSPSMLIAGVKEFMESIKADGYLIGIASSSPLKNIELVISKCGLGEFVDKYISGQDVEFSKPHPEIYTKIASRLNVSPEDCIVIEDSTNGIKAAKAAKMKCAAYKNPNSLGQTYEDAHIIFDKFSTSNYNIIKRS